MRALWMIATLVVIGAVSGAVLALVYSLAEPMIEQNKAEELHRAIFDVLPGAEEVKEYDRDGLKLYEGIDGEGKTVGYAFKITGTGFQGNITLMVGIAPGGKKLTGIQVLESVETPGLGAKITEEWFRKQFRGLDVSVPVEYVKLKEPEKPNQIKAITGATISSRAVVRIVNEAVKTVREKFGDIIGR